MNPARHFSEYIWENNIYYHFGDEIDDHRAEAITLNFIPKYYLHDKRVKKWIAEKWPQWEVDPHYGLGKSLRRDCRNV